MKQGKTQNESLSNLSLGRGVVSEEQDTNYNTEETKLFEVNQEIRNLITELEQKDNEIKAQQKA